HTHTGNLLIAFLSTIFIVSGAFADPDITSSASSADCEYDPLQTYSGTSNLQADWTANEIGLRWYNNNTLMEVESSSSGCTYDGTLTPPTAPSRTGYTFTGWKVRPTMEFTTIPTNVNGTNRWAIGWYNNANYCWYDTNTGNAWNVACSSDTTYSQELQTYEWKVKYSHGELYGMSGCSTTSGTYATAGNPTIGSGQYCWCKATGYKANGSSEVSGPLSALSWVFRSDRGSVANCAQYCAAYCAHYAEYYSAFRGALFAPGQ
ncbi:MAG: InlB B-repeat-containing protein, partial [Alphaproteobacteria bacterium]|nr:InlB B-repeat-containing protein [Alphaproteobacteria bacterium]